MKLTLQFFLFLLVLPFCPGVLVLPNRAVRRLFDFPRTFFAARARVQLRAFSQNFYSLVTNFRIFCYILSCCGTHRYFAISPKFHLLLTTRASRHPFRFGYSKDYFKMLPLHVLVPQNAISKPSPIRKLQTLLLQISSSQQVFPLYSNSVTSSNRSLILNFKKITMF
jgi:hypothetical protein